MSAPDPRHSWSRLTKAARQAPADDDVSSPYGFSTRVAALAFAAEAGAASLWERFAVRAVIIASALALGSVALNFKALTQPDVTVVVLDEDLQLADDALAVVLDFTD